MTPFIKSPQPHSGEVNSASLPWPQVKVTQHMLSVSVYTSIHMYMGAYNVHVRCLCAIERETDRETDRQRKLHTMRCSQFCMRKMSVWSSTSTSTDERKSKSLFFSLQNS